MPLAYVYRAALFCAPCTNIIKDRLRGTLSGREPEDSDAWPQGPCVDGGGEADAPQHCDRCGLFLENTLTKDGHAYVKDQCSAYGYGIPDNDDDDESWMVIAKWAGQDDRGTLAEWIRFYYGP